MAIDYRPQARAVLQNPDTSAYQTLAKAGLLELNKGAAIAALAQTEALTIIRTLQISKDTIDRLVSLRDRTGGKYTEKTRASSSRKTGRVATIPSTHTLKLAILGKYERSHFDSIVDAVKAVGGRYHGEEKNWYIDPAQLPNIPESAATELYRMDPYSSIWTPLSTGATSAPASAPTSPVQPFRPSVPVNTSPAPQAAPEAKNFTFTKPTPTEEPTEAMSTAPISDASFEDALKAIAPVTDAAGVVSYSPMRRNNIARALALSMSPTMAETQIGHNADLLHYADDPQTVRDLIDTLAKSDTVPDAEPMLGHYTSRASEYAIQPMDPTGLLGARQAYYAARQAYDKDAEAWYGRSANRDRLNDAICTSIALLARYESERLAKLAKLEEEAKAEEARKALFGDAQSKLETMRAHAATLDVLISGARPKLDPKYNLAPEFSRLFHALAWQLVTFGRAEHVLLTGPKGTGKTKAASVLASMIGLDLFILNCQTVRDVRETFAERNADEGKTYWSPTDFTSAVRRGYTVILLDEVTRAPGSVQNAFLSLLDGQGKIHIQGFGDVTPGPNIIWLATANEGAAYSGTARLDLALDDRFGVRWEMAHLETEQAAHALLAHLGLAGLAPATTTHNAPQAISLECFAPHGITANVCQALAGIASDIQAAYSSASAAARLSHDEGQRTVESMGRNWLATGPESLKYSLLSRYKDDERKAVAEIVSKRLAEIK